MRDIALTETPASPQYDDDDEVNAVISRAYDEAAMEAAVERARAMEQTDYDALSAAARTWFEANQRRFASLLQDALQPLLGAQPVDATWRSAKLSGE